MDRVSTFLKKFDSEKNDFTDVKSNESTSKKEKSRTIQLHNPISNDMIFLKTQNPKEFETILETKKYKKKIPSPPKKNIEVHKIDEANLSKAVNIDEVITELVKLRTLQLQQHMSLNKKNLNLLNYGKTHKNSKAIGLNKNPKKECLPCQIQETYKYTFNQPALNLNQLDGYEYLKHQKKAENQVLEEVISENKSQAKEFESRLSPSNLESITIDKYSLNSIKKISAINPKKTEIPPIKEFGEDSMQTFKSDFDESFFSNSNISRPKNSYRVSLSQSRNSEKKKVSFSKKFSERQKKSSSEFGETEVTPHVVKSPSIFGSKKIKCFLCGKMIVTKTANSHVRMCKLKNRSNKKRYSQSRIQKIASSEFIER